MIEKRNTAAKSLWCCAKLLGFGALLKTSISKTFANVSAQINSQAVSQHKFIDITKRHMSNSVRHASRIIVRERS